MLRLYEEHIVVKSAGFSRLDGTDFLKLCVGEKISLLRVSGPKEKILKVETK